MKYLQYNYLMHVFLALVLAGCGGGSGDRNTSDNNSNNGSRRSVSMKRYNITCTFILTTFMLSLLTACGGGGGNTTVENNNPPPGASGNTNGYTGRLAWSVHMFAAPILRVWDMPSSEFIVYDTFDDEIIRTHIYPSLSADQQTLTYTYLEPLSFQPSEVRVRNLEDDTLHIVPKISSDGKLRSALHSSVSGDGLSVVFIDALNEESDLVEGAPGDLVSRGLAIWTIGEAQPQRISVDLGSMICPRLSADGQRVVVMGNSGIYIIDQGKPAYLLDLNDAAIVQVTRDADIAIRCPITLSDDGNRIAFRASRNDTGHNLAVAHIHDINSNTTTHVAPAIIGTLNTYSMSADGQRMALMTTNIIREGEQVVDIIYGLYTVELSQSDTDTLVWERSFLESPSLNVVALSRDGQSIATTGIDEEFLIFVEIMRFDGTDKRIIRDDDNLFGAISLTF